MNVLDINTPEFREKMEAKRREREKVEANPTFDDLKKLWPANMRGSVPIAGKKWDQITGEGLQTRVFDKDSNSYEEVFLKATPQEIYMGAKEYLNSMRGKDYALSQYTKRLQNFLNGGYWQQ